MRLKILSNIITALIIFLCFGFFYLQGLKGEKFFYLSEKNRIRIIPQIASRGKMLDRNGLVLVDSRISFNLFLIPRDLQDKEKFVSSLSKILEVTREKVRRQIDKAARETIYKPSLIFEDIPKEKAFAVEEEIFDFPGLMVEAVPVRSYRFQEAGSHIFGYLGEINRFELEGLRDYGYRMKDFIGRSGLEKTYNNYLKGEDGGMQVEVDSFGRRIKLLGFKAPKSGNDLYLTIDMRLQNFANKALAGRIGVVVVMNPKTGEILCLVSSPEFDPNIFVSSSGSKMVKDILSDTSKPLINRAISAYYPPGSVFKIVTASAGLETGKIGRATTFNCTGKFFLGNAKFECWEANGHGTEDIFSALRDSCNVYFYNTGRIVGVDEISSFAVRFGFGRPTGVDLSDELPGIVPSRLWKMLTKNESWYEGETINYAIGQGALTATPMQVLRMVSVIANNGELVQPYLVRRIGKVEVATTKFKNLNLSQNTIDIIKQGLIKVVQDPTGTGRHAKVEGISAAGKTGTAQAGVGKSPHAWFVGFAPAEDPKFAVVVLLEHGGKGGLGAAEIAREIFKEARLEELL